MAEPRDFRFHTCAMNARDVETLAAQAAPHAPCFCDGEWVGEGPEAVRAALAKEFAVNEDIFARVGEHLGEPAILQFDSGGAERSALRFRGGPGVGVGRFQELRIDHPKPPRRPEIIPAGLSDPDV
ncbi:MAG: hypothetical protein QOJ26_924 [Thermoplasmata archaeon]|jgi:hypothetical protein|nr:hypothetical protein [Thermoplasmata archaeon]MEA3166055.1 hypothetical protein [Thermoplasmata archaeon]